MLRLLRGVLLVVIGIIIGIVVLANTLDEADESDETQASGGTVATTTVVQDTASTTIPTQPTTQVVPTNPLDAPTTSATLTIPDPTILPPEQVRVQVFNGTDTQGAAGRMTTTLAASNYVTLPPKNAPDGGQYDTSSVYFSTPDYLANAGHVASLLGVTNPGVIQQLPNLSPITHDRAHIIVVIGDDGLAS